MDNTYCCVPQCRSRGNAFPRTSFHHFPHSVLIRNQWILKLKIGKEVSTRMVVCGKHFQNSDYFPGEKRKKRLKRNAVPSQNLPVGWGSSESEEIFKNRKETSVKQEERANFSPDDFESEESDSNEKTEEEKKLNISDLIMKPKEENLFMDSETIQTSDQDSDIETSSEMHVFSENESSSEDSDCEIDKLSEDHKTEQILREELKIMRERYKKARKKKQLYKHQWKQCLKQVECLKTVIQNLKEINSVREDC